MFKQRPFLAGKQLEHGVLALAHAQFLQIPPALQRQHTVMTHVQRLFPGSPNVREKNAH